MVGLADPASFWNESMIRLRRKLAVLGLAGVVALAFGVEGRATPPDPGTRISSQAILDYIDPVSFVSDETPSNIVRVVVSGIPLINVTQDNSLTRTAGGYFEFAHQLTNTGNVTGTYTITPSLVGATAFDLLNAQLVLDLNGNGLVDTGEPRLPLAPYTVTLAPGQTLDFVVTGQVSPSQPASLPPSSVGHFSFAVSLAETGATASNTDTLTVVVTPGVGDLQFFKTISTPQAVSGDTVIYTLTGTNNYPADMSAINVTIDGAIVSRIVVRDNLPANLQLVQILTTSGSTPLYHVAGEPLGTYHSSAPSSLGSVDAVGYAFAAIPVGMSFSVSYKARVTQMATGTIPNTAEVYSLNSGGTQITESNTVNLIVPTAKPTINYYNNDQFATIIPATHLGSPLYIQVVAGACNARADTIETITVVITSSLTGDHESFTATETGFNTGIFRILPSVPTQDASVNPAKIGDGVIQTLPNDQLTAEIAGCGGITVQTEILIDPSGVVYDSRTNAPLAGATVALIDVTGGGNGGNAGGPARVLDDDAITALSATQVTKSDGEYRYPMVSASTYFLKVTPPANYTFPSVVPAGAQPAGRRYSNPASIGGNFPVNTSTGSVYTDIPLDTTLSAGLTLAKTASRKTAEIGDSVIYSLTLKNTSGAPFNGTFISDNLPLGFRYEAGTTRRDGKVDADPAGTSSRVIKFNIGTLANGATTVLTYRLRIVPGAEKGDGVNTAQATSLGPPVLISNDARAQVVIDTGVFDSDGVIIGTVFVDANGNGIQDPGEPGVPGVRLFLEDGTYVITDGQGKYSIYGQRAITHILKVDPYTLPPGAILGGDGPRFAMDPGSLFVDLKKYELHKANFMLVKPTKGLYAAIAKRRAQSDSGISELTTALATQITADGVLPVLTDVQAREASGVVGSGHSTSAGFNNVLPAGTLTSGNSSLPERPVSATPMIPLEKLVKDITDSAPGFIGLKDGDTLPSPQITVRIKGKAGAKLGLLLNSRPVPERSIGKTVEQIESGIQAVEYIAINLYPGSNTLELTQSDLFGNVRERKTIHVIAPDELAQFKVECSTPSPVADGRTPVVIKVTATDRHGVPVSASMPVTLETTLGRWDVIDLDSREPGTQTTISGGRGAFKLLPPANPGETHIVVSSGLLKTEMKLVFLPELRPMIAAGIIDGRIGFQRIPNPTVIALTPSNAFEEDLRNSAGIGGSGDSAARGAFYLKGTIEGNNLLTVAYDSDKRKDDVALFRDIDPNAYFPVYGDSGVRGYDAQSTGNLYVRVDHDRSYALLGDFNTRSDSEVRQLGDYNRSLNGVRLHYENSNVKAGVWASDDSTTQVVQEIPANGTSGPFNFQSGAGVLNSETVEILTRDRNQRSVILSTQQLARNTDYEFEPFTGRLLLRRPVPSEDSNFNPLSLRITYEVDSGGSLFWVYGGNVQTKLTKRFEVGGSFVHDENPTAPYDLESANGTVNLGKDTFLIAEGARSESLKNGIGFGERVELRRKSDGMDARVFFGRTDKQFDNPSSQLDSGRDEGGAKITKDLAPHTQLVTEAVYTADLSGAGNNEGVRVDVVHTLPGHVRLTIGARASEGTETPTVPVATNPAATATSTTTSSTSTTTPTTTPAANEGIPISVRSVRVRADAPVPYLPQASVFGEYEQDVVTPDQRLVAVGGNYQVSSKTRLYLREEIISTLGSPFELNTSQQNNRTLVGIDTEYLRDAHFFNEYRIKEAIDGAQAETATGLRNAWPVAEGLRLQTTFERVTPFGGLDTDKSTAATVAADYTRPTDWKASGRVEGRDSPSGDNYLNTFGYARKINDAWTFLGRTILNVQTVGNGPSAGAGAAAMNATGFNSDPTDLFQGRVLAGLAWRQTGKDEWNALFRYEYKYEQGSPDLGATDLHRQVHMIALSVNYQPDSRWIFAGHYATKFVREIYDDAPKGQYVAHLLAGRVIFELNRKWDAGLNSSVTFSQKLGNAQYAIGPEVGYSFAKNVRVGLGYNLVGFTDQDFDASATAHGLFLTLHVKFDESLLKWARFDGPKSAP